jgi:hypothetical protein
MYVLFDISNLVVERAVNIFEGSLPYALQVFQDYRVAILSNDDVLEDANGFEIANPRSFFINFFHALEQLDRWDSIEQYSRMIAGQKGKEAVTSLLSELTTGENGEKFVSIIVGL